MDRDREFKVKVVIGIAILLILVIWMIALYKGYNRDLDDPRSDYNSIGECP